MPTNYLSATIVNSDNGGNTYCMSFPKLLLSHAFILIHKQYDLYVVLAPLFSKILFGYNLEMW